jgi:hypothetical protein
MRRLALLHALLKRPPAEDVGPLHQGAEAIPPAEDGNSFTEWEIVLPYAGEDRRPRRGGVFRHGSRREGGPVSSGQAINESGQTRVVGCPYKPPERIS